MPPDATLQPEISSNATSDSVAEGADPVRKRIDGLANAIRSLHLREARGDLASLRRMDEDEAIEPAFQRILVRVAPDASLQNDRWHDNACRLALTTKILALGMSPEVLADGYRNLGEVMARPDIDIKERRVQGLMTARGSALDDLLLRLSRQLVRKGTLPFLDIGRLILGSPASVERTRFRIAKGFWGARRDADDAPPTEQPAGGESE